MREALDAVEGRRQGAPAPDRPDRHPARARAICASRGHPARARRARGVRLAPAGADPQPRRRAAREREGAAQFAGRRASRRVRLCADPGDGPARGAVAADPPRDQGGRERRRRPRSPARPTRSRSRSCSPRSSGMVSALRDRPQARPVRPGRRAAQGHPRCRPRAAHRARPVGQFAVGPPARRSAPRCRSLLKTEIETVPGRVRRLLRPRPASEIGPQRLLDAGDVAEIEALIEFVGACRNYASELAINEVTLRVHSELQHYLETGTAGAARRAAQPATRRSPVPPVAGRRRGALLPARCSAQAMPRCSPRRPRSPPRAASARPRRPEAPPHLPSTGAGRAGEALERLPHLRYIPYPSGCFWALRWPFRRDVTPHRRAASGSADVVRRFVACGLGGSRRAGLFCRMSR